MVYRMIKEIDPYHLTAGALECGEMHAFQVRIVLSFPCPHFLGRISPIFSPFSPVFCAFSPPRQDGSNEPQAETQGQETAARGPRAENSAARGQVGGGQGAPLQCRRFSALGSGLRLVGTASARR